MKHLIYFLVFSSLVFSAEATNKYYLKLGFLNNLSQWDYNDEVAYRFAPLGERTLDYSIGGELSFGFMLYDHLEIELMYQGNHLTQSFDANTYYYSNSKTPSKGYEIETEQSFNLSLIGFYIGPYFEFYKQDLSLKLGYFLSYTTNLKNVWRVDGYEISQYEFLDAIEIGAPPEIRRDLKPNNLFSIRLEYSYEVLSFLELGTHISYNYFADSIMKESFDIQDVQFQPHFWQLGIHAQFNLN